MISVLAPFFPFSDINCDYSSWMNSMDVNHCVPMCRWLTGDDPEWLAWAEGIACTDSTTEKPQVSVRSYPICATMSEVRARLTPTPGVTVSNKPSHKRIWPSVKPVVHGWQHTKHSNGWLSFRRFEDVKPLYLTLLVVWAWRLIMNYSVLTTTTEWTGCMLVSWSNETK